MTEGMFKDLEDIVSLALQIGFTLSGVAVLSGYAIGKAMEAFNIAAK